MIVEQNGLHMKIIAEKIFDRFFVRVFDLIYAPGKHYYCATRRDENRLVSVMSDKQFSIMMPDAVSCCVIFRTADKEPQMLLNKEYRYPLGRYVYSVPAGLIDTTEQNELKRDSAIISTAKRELFEETGIHVTEKDKLSVINPCLFSSPGLTDESNAVVMIELFDHDVGEINQNGAEGSELFDGYVFVDRLHAKEMMRNESISTYTWVGLSVFLDNA